MRSSNKIFTPDRAPSYRQLRVGEEIRHILASLLTRGDIPGTDLLNVSITVTQVQVSGDLRNATAFIRPLGGQGSEQEQQDILDLLQGSVGYFRRQVGSQLRLRYTPDLKFAIDRSFEYAARIDQLLSQAKKRA